jgi:hypothetical protein
MAICLGRIDRWVLCSKFNFGSSGAVGFSTQNAVGQWRLVAHRVISRRCGNSVAFELKRTSGRVLLLDHPPSRMITRAKRLSAQANWPKAQSDASRQWNGGLRGANPRYVVHHSRSESLFFVRSEPHPLRSESFRTTSRFCCTNSRAKRIFDIVAASEYLRHISLS